MSSDPFIKNEITISQYRLKIVIDGSKRAKLIAWKSRFIIYEGQVMLL